MYACPARGDLPQLSVLDSRLLSVRRRSIGTHPVHKAAAVPVARRGPRRNTYTSKRRLNRSAIRSRIGPAPTLPGIAGRRLALIVAEIRQVRRLATEHLRKLRALRYHQPQLRRCGGGPTIIPSRPRPPGHPARARRRCAEARRRTLQLGRSRVVRNNRRASLDEPACRLLIARAAL